MIRRLLPACVVVAASGCVANPVQPTQAPVAAPVVAHAEARQCDSDKRRCSEMRDCAEAVFYLRECGVKGLDRDGDGVPCESLCKR